MPLLSCTARTCIYNKGELCTKGDIEVDGSMAKMEDETCCKSFVERKEGTSNCVDSGSVCPAISVNCKACSCTYNKDEKCDAAKITIAGASACKCEDTKCASFCCK